MTHKCTSTLEELAKTKPAHRTDKGLHGLTTTMYQTTYYKCKGCKTVFGLCEAARLENEVESYSHNLLPYTGALTGDQIRQYASTCRGMITQEDEDKIKGGAKK